MLDFGFATEEEIAQALAGRLKQARLLRGVQQSELALRAGVSEGTVKALENTGRGTVSSLIRVVRALGLEGDLQNAFIVKVQSIADMERTEKVKKRAPNKRRASTKAAL